jgi:hypothetical protein
MPAWTRNFFSFIFDFLNPKFFLLLFWPLQPRIGRSDPPQAQQTRFGGKGSGCHAKDERIRCPNTTGCRLDKRCPWWRPNQGGRLDLSGPHGQIRTISPFVEQHCCCIDESKEVSGRRGAPLASDRARTSSSGDHSTTFSDILYTALFQNSKLPEVLVNLIAVSQMLNKPADTVNRYIACVHFSFKESYL